MTEPEFIEVRKTFPLFPEEVFQLWLDDRVRQNGWPPSGFEWQGFLFGMPITYWQQLKWTKQLVILNTYNLSETANTTANQIIEVSVFNMQNIISTYIPNTRKRFISILRYAQKYQRLPEPIILLQRDDLFDVVEGNHRVSVLLTLQKLNGVNGAPLVEDVVAWVAKE